MTKGPFRSISLIAALAASLTATSNTSAIEGLQLSVQCSNVVLSWPGTAGQNYIVQYRPTLDPGTPWQTLTNSFPADESASLTVFVHSNIVQHPNCGASGGGSFAEMSSGGQADSTALAVVPPSRPMVMRADGSGRPVPLCLYPPGLDLGNYIIFDPSTGEWLSGVGYSTGRALSSSADIPLPIGGGSGGGTNSVAPPETGFYQVVQDGVRIADSSLSNLTNGTISGLARIAFEAGTADPNNGTNLIGLLDSATLVVDGVKFPGDATLSAPPGRPWQFTMDTGFLENGDHTVWVDVTWQYPGNYDNPVFARSSDPFSITVSNAIYYPQWEPEIGEADLSAYLAKVTSADSDWQLDIYDCGSNLVKTLTGHTTDGTILAVWNMLDMNNVARTNAGTDPWFDAMLSASGLAAKKLPRKNQRTKDWPDQGKWVVAYQDYFKFQYDENGYLKSSINSFSWTGQSHGGVLLYYPQPGQTNDIGQTYPIRFQKTNHFDPSITKEAIAKDHALLIYYLTNNMAVRNFYIACHGSPTTMAGLLPSSRVGDAVKQRYRFVFLDGCLTAKGDWDKAFGINGPGVFDLTYYQTSGIRPAAFCGYDCLKYYATGGPVDHGGVHYDNTIPWQAGGYMVNFVFYWDAAEYSLADSFYFAKQGLPSIIPGYWPGDGLQIYGYDGLTVDGYNHMTDWP